MATENTLKLKFLTEAGSNFTLNITNASATLVETSTPISTLVNYIIQQQPFTVVLTSLVSATLVATTETDIPLTGVTTVSDLLRSRQAVQR